MEKKENFLMLKNINHNYSCEKNTVTNSLDNISIDLADGEFVTVVGPSGCGKTTLFNIAAGLLTPTQGSVILKGQDVTGKTGHVGYMLQRDLLLPWRTVLKNVILGLELQGISREESEKEAIELLNRFSLGQFINRYPDTLSGGMRQRCAFIRTLLSRKDILLLDEPLGALDAQTRVLMQEWLLDVWEEFRKTVFFITHDIDEAVFLSDRIYVLSSRPGRLLEEIKVDLPRPRNSSIRYNPKFVEYKEHIVDLIRSESIASLENNN